MPYKSDAQRRYFNANRKELEEQGVDVDEWNESSKGKKLPEKVKEKKANILGSIGKGALNVAGLVGETVPALTALGVPTVAGSMLNASDPFGKENLQRSAAMLPGAGAGVLASAVAGKPILKLLEKLAPKGMASNVVRKRLLPYGGLATLSAGGALGALGAKKMTDRYMGSPAEQQKEANLNPLVNMPNMSGMYSQMSQIARQPNMMGTGPASNYQPSQATSDMNQLIHTTNRRLGYNPLGTGMPLNRPNPYSMGSPQQRQQAENMSRQMDKQFNPYGTGMGFNGGLGGGLNGSSVGGNYGQAAGTNAAAVPGASQMKLGSEKVAFAAIKKLLQRFAKPGAVRPSVAEEMAAAVGKSRSAGPRFGVPDMDAPGGAVKSVGEDIAAALGISGGRRPRFGVPDAGEIGSQLKQRYSLPTAKNLLPGFLDDMNSAIKPPRLGVPTQQPYTAQDIASIGHDYSKLKSLGGENLPIIGKMAADQLGKLATVEESAIPAESTQPAADGNSKTSILKNLLAIIGAGGIAGHAGVGLKKLLSRPRTLAQALGQEASKAMKTVGKSVNQAGQATGSGFVTPIRQTGGEGKPFGLGRTIDAMHDTDVGTSFVTPAMQGSASLLGGGASLLGSGASALSNFAKKMDKYAATSDVEKLAKLVAARCWEGYEPVPGKKPYSDGSCQPQGEKSKAKEKKASIGKLLAGTGIGGALGTLLGRYTGYNAGYNKGSSLGEHESLLNLLRGMHGVMRQGAESNLDLKELVNKKASSGCSCGSGNSCQCNNNQNNRASECEECGEVNCNCQKEASDVAMLGKIAAMREKMAFRLLPGRRQQAAPQQYAAPQQQAPGYASVNDFQRPTGPLPSDRSEAGAAAWQPAPQGMTRMRNDVTGDVFYAPSVEAGRQYMGDAASAAKLGIKPGQRVDQGYQQQMDASRQRAMSPPSVSPAAGAASRGMGLGLSAIGKGITGLAQSAGQGVVAAGRYGNEALEASRRAQQTNAMQMKRNEPVVGPITGTTAAEKAQAASPVGNTGTIYDTYKGYDARTGAHAPKPAPAAPYRPVGGGRNY